MTAGENLVRAPMAALRVARKLAVLLCTVSLSAPRAPCHRGARDGFRFRKTMSQMIPSPAPQRCRMLVAALALLWPLPGLAEAEPDLRNGKDINETCAGCHGEFGQGGKAGEYPRLAGQPIPFLVRQLVLFRERHRPNMAMIEYVDQRQMPDDDIRDISAYLAGIRLPTRMPEVDPNTGALERLELAKKVFNVPPVEGHPEAGEKLYKKECKSCHGENGAGHQAKGVPMIGGQFTNYLWKQVDLYRKGIRIHDPDDPQDRLLNEFEDKDLQNIFAYLAIADDR